MRRGGVLKGASRELLEVDDSVRVTSACEWLQHSCQHGRKSQKSSEMVRQDTNRFRNGLGKAQKRSEAYSLESGDASLRNAQKRLRKSPGGLKRLRNGRAAQKGSEMVREKPKKAQKWLENGSAMVWRSSKPRPQCNFVSFSQTFRSETPSILCKPQSRACARTFA